MRIILVLGIMLAVLALASCSKGTTVRQLDPDETVELVGEWNDNDSREVATAMIADSLNRPWVSNFHRTHDRSPRVQVAPHEVRVRTDGDVIAKDIFLNEIRQAFINSGLVTVISTMDEAGTTRSVIADQQEFAREETRATQRAETGADYVLSGSINVQHQVEGRREVRYYQVSLMLTDVETREQVWMKNVPRRKFVEHRRRR